MGEYEHACGSGGAVLREKYPLQDRVGARREGSRLVLGEGGHGRL